MHSPAEMSRQYIPFQFNIIQPPCTPTANSNLEIRQLRYTFTHTKLPESTRSSFVKHQSIMVSRKDKSPFKIRQLITHFMSKTDLIQFLNLLLYVSSIPLNNSKNMSINHKHTRPDQTRVVGEEKQNLMKMKSDREVKTQPMKCVSTTNQPTNMRR